MKQRTFACPVFFFLITFMLTLPACATDVRFWTLSERSDFERGTLQGVSILGSGGITLSPRITPLNGNATQNTTPFFWCQAADSSGNRYIGSGNDGIVFKISRDDRISTFFRSSELEVTALAVDGNDNLYAGTSPQGMIYKISKNGNAEIFCEPEERYIWALAFDPKENLFVATGERGRILKVTKNGEYDVFFDSEEPHIVTLAFDKSGNLLAGSDGKGIIYRISPGGKGEVIFSSEMKEISSTAALQDGTILFSAIARPEAEPRPSPVQMTLRELISAEELEKRLAESAVDEETGKKFTATIEGLPLPEKEKAVEMPRSTVFALSARGEIQRYLDLFREHVFALCVGTDEKIYLGTGEPGKIYRLEDKGRATLLGTFNESHVTSIIPFRSSGISLTTSNMGRAYLLDPELESTGVFISKTFDSGMKSEWGTMSCALEHGEGASIELYTRSGNSGDPDSAWSAWSKPYNPYKKEKIESPPARYIQLKVHFTGAAPSRSAVLKNVSIAYLNENRPPEIAHLTIVKPGEKADVSAGSEPASGAQEKTEKAIGRGEKGIIWKASDPNDDLLRAAVYYRRTDQDRWTRIEETPTGNFYLWNHLSLPDGMYSIKVVVDDSRSNCNGTEKSSEIQSALILIDNTPPTLNVTSQNSEERILSITVAAHDDAGRIRTLYYSTDQKNWTMARPDDRLCDSSDESFRLSVDMQDATVLFLKCIDDSLNESTLDVR